MDVNARNSPKMNVSIPSTLAPSPDVSYFGLILFNFLLPPSSLGSIAPPQRAVGWDNHAGGLGDHAVRSRRSTESVRRHHRISRSSLRLSSYEKIL